MANTTNTTRRPESRQHTESRMAAMDWRGSIIDGYTHAVTGARIERVVTWRVVGEDAPADPLPTLNAALVAWGRTPRGWKYRRLRMLRTRAIRRGRTAAGTGGIWG